MRPTKEEVMAFLKPSPVTREELAGLEKLAPGDYEIYSERINMILAECKDVFTKVGNSNWVLSGDLIVGLHNKQGDLISSCLGTFIHSVTAQNPVKWIMHNFYDNPRVGVHEGDIFYCNEATYGGIHNCDQLALMPIFHDGELIAWASSGTHMDETGGIAPGGMIAYAKSRYDEGMNLTPIKIAENYQIGDDMIEMLVNRISRAPRQQVLDLRARCTAVDRLRMRIQQLAEQKGNDFVRGLLRKTMMVAEEGARNRIRRWNDGIYRNLCFQSGIGVKAGSLAHFLHRLQRRRPYSLRLYRDLARKRQFLQLLSLGDGLLRRAAPVLSRFLGPAGLHRHDGADRLPHSRRHRHQPKLGCCHIHGAAGRGAEHAAAPQALCLHDVQHRRQTGRLPRLRTRYSAPGGMVGGGGSVGGFGFGSGAEPAWCTLHKSGRGRLDQEHRRAGGTGGFGRHGQLNLPIGGPRHRQ